MLAYYSRFRRSSMLAELERRSGPVAPIPVVLGSPDRRKRLVNLTLQAGNGVVMTAGLSLALSNKLSDWCH
jgi:hypothetical protein